MVQNVFASFPGGLGGALAIVMLVIFLLGFILILSKSLSSLSLLSVQC